MHFVDREFRPVILGSDITSYSLMRTFYEEYKVKSILVNMSKGSPISDSSLCDTYSYDNLDREDVFIDKILDIARKYQDKKLIILAANDRYARRIIENREKLEKYYIIPYINLDLSNEIVLKDKFYDICDKLDIPHPKTFVYDLKEKNELNFDFSYPIIAKTANSSLYHYYNFPGKKKVFTFDNLEDLKVMLNNLAKSGYDYKFLIQDRIPGDDSNMRVLTCYSDRNAKVKFFALGHVLLEEHTPTALGNPCVILNDKNMEIFEHAKRFLEYVGYTGFSNFDIKYDERDGKYKFFEINTRLGRSNYYITGAGFNVSKYIVDDLIYNKEIESKIAYKEHLFTFVPKYVIKHYIKDSKEKDLALKYMKTGNYSNPLYFKGEENMTMKIYRKLYSLNQIRKFIKYGDRK